MRPKFRYRHFFLKSIDRQLFSKKRKKMSKIADFAHLEPLWSLNANFAGHPTTKITIVLVLSNYFYGSLRFWHFVSTYLVCKDRLENLPAKNGVGTSALTLNAVLMIYLGNNRRYGHLTWQQTLF